MHKKMNHEQFEEFARRITDEALELMFKKNSGYSTESDPFHNFRTAAKLRNELPVQSAAGMMAKHTVSVYKLIGLEGTTKRPLTPEEIEKRLEVWDEKILDNINYLIMIRAMIQENHQNHQS